MSAEDIIRAWKADDDDDKDEKEEKDEKAPENPAGQRELSDKDLDEASGGQGTSNNTCQIRCYMD